jgi:hypothetical protein
MADPVRLVVTVLRAAETVADVLRDAVDAVARVDVVARVAAGAVLAAVEAGDGSS